MNDLYSTYTREHIPDSAPASEWMGRAGVDAPEYNPQTHSAFWKDGAWEVAEVDTSKQGEFL